MKKRWETGMRMAKSVGMAAAVVALVGLAGCSVQTDSISRGEQAAAVQALEAVGVHVHLQPGGGTRVVGFNFYRSDAGTNELRQVLKFPEISELDLTGTDFTDSDVLTLAPLVHLEKFNVFGMDHLTDRGFAVVTNFTELREVRATHMNISDLSLERLGSLKSLERVYIGPTEPGPTAEGLKAISSRGFAALSGLTHLQSLYIVGRGVLPLQVTDDDLTALGAATNLTSLTLSSCRLTGRGLTYLNAPLLKSLCISHAAVDVSGIRAMAMFPDLESLNLYGNKLKGCLAPLSEGQSFRSLKSLSLMQSGVDDTDIQHLAELPVLEKLVLYNCPVTDAALDALSRIPKLRYVDGTKTGISAGAAEQFRQKTMVEIHVGD